MRDGALRVRERRCGENRIPTCCTALQPFLPGWTAMRCVVLCCVQAVALAKGFAAKGVPRNRRTIGVLKVRPAL